MVIEYKSVCVSRRSRWVVISFFNYELLSDQIEAERLFLAGALDDDEDFCAGPAPQAMLDNISEIAPHGLFAVDAGDDVTGLYSGEMSGPAGYELLYLDPAVGQGDPVYADPAEVFRGIAGPGCSRKQMERKRYDESPPDHGETIPQGEGEVKAFVLMAIRNDQIPLEVKLQ